MIAVVENKDDRSVLMRKKPAGTAPYKETWYLFGCEPLENQDNVLTLTNYLKEEIGIEVLSVMEVARDEEVKEDKDGIVKKFIYIDFHCYYRRGAIKVPKGIEKVEWVPRNKFDDYDLVPPSRKLLGELNKKGL